MILQKTIAGVVAVVALLLFVGGAVLPWRMAGNYIGALRQVGQGNVSLDGFKSLFKDVFEFPSPVGLEETVKFLSGDLKAMVANQEETVAKDLADFIEPYLFKNEVRHLLIRAEIRSILWRRFGEQEDFIRAAEAYQEIGRIGKFLPQPLYGLYGLFGEAGQKELADRVGREILKIWPSETRIKISQ